MPPVTLPPNTKGTCLKEHLLTQLPITYCNSSCHMPNEILSCIIQGCTHVHTYSKTSSEKSIAQKRKHSSATSYICNFSLNKCPLRVCIVSTDAIQDRLALIMYWVLCDGKGTYFYRASQHTIQYVRMSTVRVTWLVTTHLELQVLYMESPVCVDMELYCM